MLPRIEPLDREEERRLACAARRGDAGARDQLILANEGLVRFVAAGYVEHGIEFEDLVSEGRIGLIRGLDNFDPDRGYRVSTYVVWWIGRACRRAVQDHSRVVRAPSQVHELRGKWDSVQAALSAELGRQPSDQEIADRVHDEFYTHPDREGVVDRVRCFDATGALTSLDEVTASVLDGDAVDDEDEDTALLALIDERLSAESAEIIKARYWEGLTLREVGLLVGLSKERVRQIQIDALAVLGDVLGRRVGRELA